MNARSGLTFVTPAQMMLGTKLKLAENVSGDDDDC